MTNDSNSIRFIPLNQQDSYHSKSKISHENKVYWESSSWLDRVFFFSFINSLIDLGQRKVLELEDCKAKSISSIDDINNLKPLILKQFIANGKNLKKTIINTFKYQSLIGIIPNIAVCINRMLIPFVVALFIEYASHNYEYLGYSPYLIGFTLSFILFLLMIFDSLFEEWSKNLCWRIALRVQVSVQSLVYNKLYYLNNNKIDKGSITNLIQEDPFRIADFSWHIHKVYMSPLEAALELIYLYYLLNEAALVALVILIILIPIATYFGHKFENANDVIMNLKDNRVNIISEILNAINIVKVFCMEEIMKKKINEIRTEELKHILALNNVLAFFMFIILSACSLLSLFVFGVYTYVLEYDLTATVIFPSLLLIRNVTWIAIRAPQVITCYTTCISSLNRVQKFLDSEELETDWIHYQNKNNNNINRNDNIIEIKNLTVKYPEIESLEENQIKQNDTQNDVKVTQKQSVFDQVINYFRPSNNNNKGNYELLELDNIKIDSEDQDQREDKSEDSDSKIQFRMKLDSLNIKRGEFVIVIGSVGAGKSSLFNTIRGEMSKINDNYDNTNTISNNTPGSVNINTDSNNICYSSQQSWILSGTIRNNILMDLPHDISLYNSCLESCELLYDIDLWADSDMTYIGEKGISISGGQKQRLALARAVYRGLYSKKYGTIENNNNNIENNHLDNDIIYLFDDVLSAVDSEVGKKIFQQLMGKSKGLLRKNHEQNTIIFITNQIQYLKYADRVIDIDQGEIINIYTGEEASNINFNSLLLKRSESTESTDSNPDAKGHNQTDLHNNSTNIQKLVKQIETTTFAMVDDEDRAVGRVEYQIYWNYLKVLGSWKFLLVLFIVSSIQAINAIGERLWLTYWSDNTTTNISTEKLTNNDNNIINNNNTHGNTFYLSFYCLFAFISSATSLTRQLTLSKGCTTASRYFHNNLLNSILRAPMSFFYSNPTGRILTRFSRDINVIDTSIPDQFSDVALMAFGGIATMCVFVYEIPISIMILFIVTYLSTKLQRLFSSSSRELDRIASLSKSTLSAYSMEMVNGLSLIRAHNLIKWTNQKIEKLQNEANLTCFLSDNCFHWFDVRFFFLVNLFVLSITIISVLSYNSNLFTGGLVGFLLSTSISQSKDLNWLLRVSSQLEISMNSVNRILHYSAMKSEAELETSIDMKDNNHKLIEKDWPKSGDIVLKNINLRYKPHLPLALNNINLHIQSGSRIGIVGRSGSGKSSLTSLLFRLIEPLSISTFNSEYTIDSVDCLKLGLHSLRSVFSLIPQDPQLFEGTIRYNLDPSNIHNDREIYQVLSLVSLQNYIQSLNKGLDTQLINNGNNFSVGQRQLLCTARALLNDKAKIILLDEPTANIDHNTDKCIQQAIKSDLFQGKTIITIAHRLETVIYYDKIIVMNNGQIVEYDEPSKLLMNSEGYLYNLVKQTGKDQLNYYLQKLSPNHSNNKD